MLNDEDIQPWLSKDVEHRWSELLSEYGGNRLHDVLAAALSDAAQSWVLNQCQACPQCLVLVSKADGCNDMMCRCGKFFCFACGAPRINAKCLCTDESGAGESPRLALWLSQFEAERLGEFSEALQLHWADDGALAGQDEPTLQGLVKQHREQQARARQVEEAAAERRRQRRQQLAEQSELRWRRADEEATAERTLRQRRSVLGELLWLAGADVPMPARPEDPGQRYWHRCDLWYHDGCGVDEPLCDDFGSDCRFYRDLGEYMVDIHLDPLDWKCPSGPRTSRMQRQAKPNRVWAHKEQRRQRHRHAVLLAKQGWASHCRR